MGNRGPGCVEREREGYIAASTSLVSARSTPEKAAAILRDDIALDGNSREDMLHNGLIVGIEGSYRNLELILRGVRKGENLEPAARAVHIGGHLTILRLPPKPERGLKVELPPV